MQKNKIVLAVTAVVVLALLFAGVGYAFSGNARTYNEGDSQTLAYMSVTPKDFNPIFTGNTIFDSYVYYENSEKKTAYAFNSDAADVVDVTTTSGTYKAVKLGAKDMTVLNNTGAALTELTFTVKATNAVGNTDFVFIFKLNTYQDATTYDANTTYYVISDGEYTVASPQPADLDAIEDGEYYVDEVSYIEYNGTATGTANLDVALADAASEVVTVTVFIGYIPNVYVPNSFIGTASATEGLQTKYWASGVTYYDSIACTSEADPQPEKQADVDAAIVAGTPFFEKGLPYKQSTTGPVDLATTAFGIAVTDANA